MGYNASRGGACLMARAVAILHTYGDFDAIGISTAGQVDSEQGSIYYANDNIPGYTGTKIRDILEAEFGVPVAVENDVNAAALGELYFGAAKGAENFLCLTYGTGVGGAIVIDGSIYPGSTWSGGSFGGILTHPEAMEAGVEFSGCYEKYASTTGTCTGRRCKWMHLWITDGRYLKPLTVRKSARSLTVDR